MPQQAFLVSNRNSTTFYTSAANPGNLTLGSDPIGVAPTGAKGTVNLFLESTNTTAPQFGILFPAGNYTAGGTTTGGLATNWTAIRPNPNPSPGVISYFVYTVQGLQSFPGETLAPVPTPAPSVLPSPTLIFQPQYVGDDSISLGLMSVPLTQTFQPPNGVNATFETGVPALPNTVPTAIRYPLGIRLYANFISPNQKFMYITVDGFVLEFKLENNGGLTELGFVSTGTGTRRAKSAAFSPNGDFFYVTCDTGQVAAFKADQQTGTLTAIPGSPFATGSGSLGVTFDRTGKFLYVINQVAQSISGFTFNSSTGSLTPLSNFPIGLTPGSFPAFMIPHPTKDVLYMTNMGSNAPASRPGTGYLPYDSFPDQNLVTVWTISPETGQLTLLENENGTLGQRNFLNLAADAAGRNLYITCAADPPSYAGEPAGTYGGGVNAFRINNDGSLSFEGSGAEGTAGTRVDPNGILPFTLDNRAK